MTNCSSRPILSMTNCSGMAACPYILTSSHLSLHHSNTPPLTTLTRSPHPAQPWPPPA